MSSDRAGSALGSAKVIVTAGTGGVGKTTMAAVLGMALAQSGKRCVVVTIDPAKRLAEALGLPTLTNDPQRVPVAKKAKRTTLGELWACMLDTKCTFDSIIEREATPAQASSIFANRLYNNISGSLSGTQEYMAAEKVYQLTNDDRFDVVVIDTPPAANALDFITAPRRLVRFLDHSLFRLVIAPGKGALRLVSTAAQTVLRPLTQLIGGEIVSDAIEFFQLFDGLEAGFRERAAAALDILTSESTCWVLVVTSDPQPLHAALSFTEHIASVGVRIRALIINRTEPSFGTLARASEAKHDADVDDVALREILADHFNAVQRDSAAIDSLQQQVGDVFVVCVPRLAEDVADANTLNDLASDMASSL